VCLCKTELSAEAGLKIEGDFLKKAFSCRATPQMECLSINSFLDKIQSLHADKVRILFRIVILFAMDSQHDGRLFQQIADKKFSPGSVGLFIYTPAHTQAVIDFYAGLIEDAPYNILKLVVNKRFWWRRISLAERCNKIRRR